MEKDRAVRQQLHCICEQHMCEVQQISRHMQCVPGITVLLLIVPVLLFYRHPAVKLASNSRICKDDLTSRV